MKLSRHSLAPTFRGEDIFGTPVSLAQFRGQTVLLSFFRNGACALCNLRVHELIQRYPEYQQQGLVVLAVFESPKESLLKHVGPQQAPFPLIADPNAKLYDLYGVETSREKVEASIKNERTRQLVTEAAKIGYALTPEEGSNFDRMPADFLIGPDGTIVRAFYSNVIGEHLSFEEIDQTLGEAGAA